MTFENLFKPLKIGTMEIKNRIAVAPMWAIPSDEEGYVTDAFIAYIVERARDEPGMIVIGISATEPSGLGVRGELALWDDKYIPGLEKLVKAVRRYDVKLGIELGHGGVQNAIAEQPVGPSAVPALSLPSASQKSVPRAMTVDEIKQSVTGFGKAAERCVRAGFDFIELHGAHGYLISEFLSPYFNRRNDEYGGVFENRIRFLIEVIRDCRKRIGRNIPLGVRINGEDFIKAGPQWTLADACRLAPILESESINYISVSFGVYGSIHTISPPVYEEQGAYVYMAQEVKKYISIPVAAVGRIKTPLLADSIVKEGKADIVVMGRAYIADPEFATNARNGRISDIRPCIADCLGCAEQLWRQQQLSAWPTGITCTVNPRVGRELLLKETKNEKESLSRKILVVGAGPAGLEAARRAAFSGHKIILCESRRFIGGQLRLAANIPGRQELSDLLTWYERQLISLGVEMRLNATVTEELLKQINPQAVLVATGSVSEIPLGYITGLDNIEKIELMTADELLESGRKTGDNVLVVGIDQIGLQVADYLAEQGKNVYVAGNAAVYGEKMASADTACLLGRLREKKVKRNRNVLRIEILPADKVCLVTEGKKEGLPQIDTIVIAEKRGPNRFLAEASARLGIETHIIGDASGTGTLDQGTILAAIAGGYEVARRL